MASFVYKKNNKLLSLGGFSTKSGLKSYLDFPINKEVYPILFSRIYNRDGFVFDDAVFDSSEISLLASEIAKLYSEIHTDTEYDEITRHELQRLSLTLNQLVDFDPDAVVVFCSD